MGRTAYTEPQCLYSTAITPLPRMSRTACTEPQCLYSTAIPLLPLWAVQPVQCLCACSIQLHLYSPYGPYGLYRASVPVQYSYNSTPPMARTACTEPQCLYSTAIPLLPLWSVHPLQSLCACRRVHFTFIFFIIPLHPHPKIAPMVTTLPSFSTQAEIIICCHDKEAVDATTWET